MTEESEHSQCGRGTEADGPEHSDCVCRGTEREQKCAAAGCGFCRAVRTGARMTVTGRTCAECRYVATDKQPKPIEATGFGDQMMFADEDETVYTCRAPQENPNAGRFFGATPITCDGWTGSEPAVVVDGGTDRLTELDRLIAAREARGKGRRDGD